MNSKPIAKPRRRSMLGETIQTILIALAIALVFRTVAYQPYSIPSGSMKPTLLVGDYLFVSKYAYGYSKHSLPFSPPIGDGRWLEKTPKRGDIVVFKLPRDNKTDYIKRLIGLPGDRVQVIRGVVHINDRPVGRELVDEFIEPAGPDGSTHCLRVEREGTALTCIKEQYNETLPNGKRHLTLNADDDLGYGGDNTESFLVPEGHYFFMGDNRDNSIDSRFASGVGFVPAENLVGRAEIIFLSSASNALAFWRWRPDRFFLSLR